MNTICLRRLKIIAKKLYFQRISSYLKKAENVYKINNTLNIDFFIIKLEFTKQYYNY